MQLFCLFPRRKVAYEVKVISLHQRGVSNLFGFPVIYQEKIWGEWVQTRGYEALRILHAHTLTRLLSGSTHEAQTFLDKLRKPKNHQRPLTQTKTQFNLKDISFSTKIRITIEKQTRTF